MIDKREDKQCFGWECMIKTLLQLRAYVTLNPPVALTVMRTGTFNVRERAFHAFTWTQTITVRAFIVRAAVWVLIITVNQ